MFWLGVGCRSKKGLNPPPVTRMGTRTRNPCVTARNQLHTQELVSGICCRWMSPSSTIFSMEGNDGPSSCCSSCRSIGCSGEGTFARRDKVTFLVWWGNEVNGRQALSMVGLNAAIFFMLLRMVFVALLCVSFVLLVLAEFYIVLVLAIP